MAKESIKVIFLDIDGVLNSTEFFNKWSEGIVDGTDHIDPDAVERLNFIIENTGAVVVVSSTWRLTKSVEELQDLLENHGFRGKIIDKTDDLSHIPLTHGKKYRNSVRYQEIKSWIKSNPTQIVYYVILDDDIVVKNLENQVKTTFEKGLTNKDANEAVKILGPLPPKHKNYPIASFKEMESPFKPKGTYKKKFPKIKFT